uniref:Uncharacterized protein n=1 Tax=Caenorhabditis japonica TaxID=281687 RepID=A0A8R1EJR8_CAEJA
MVDSNALKTTNIAGENIDSEQPPLRVTSEEKNPANSKSSKKSPRKRRTEISCEERPSTSTEKFEEEMNESISTIGNKRGKAMKKKCGRKRKEEEFRIFFPPPRALPETKTLFHLHNTNCQHTDWSVLSLNLPKYASYQTGWRVSYAALRSIILLDQRRGQFLKNFDLFNGKQIKKAILFADRKGIQKCEHMPKKLFFWPTSNRS